MIFAALFAFNAALSFALSLAVASLLGPAEFGRYALAVSVAAVAGTVLFEPLRMATTRFHASGIDGDKATPRATLRRAYLWASLILVVLASIAAFIQGLGQGLTVGLVGAAGLSALSLGWFDRAAALARALFLDGLYARLAIGRGVAVFTLATLAALMLKDAAAVLAATALASLLVLAGLRRELAEPAASRGPSMSLVPTFARYAVPLVASGAIYALLPAMNRAVLIWQGDPEDVGTFSLASEIGFRLFQNLGAALDLALFQLAIRAESRDGHAGAERRAADNLGLFVAVVLPAGAGFFTVVPSFEAVFVPAAFVGHIRPVFELAIPALVCLAVAQYGVNPLFAIRGRTAPTILAALVGLAANAAFLALYANQTDADVAAAQLCGFGAALACLLAVALVTGVALPWRDLGAALAATAVMTAALWPFRDAAPSAPTLAVQVAAGIGIYGTCALLLDIAGARTALLGRLRSGQK